MSDAEEVRGDTSSREFGRGTTVIARTVVRTVVPLIVVVAVALLLQGHNLPGGGFIGGVLTSTAFVLIYITFGLDYIREELLHRPTLDIVGVYRWLVSAGLAIAVFAGLAPILGGYPFLTQGVAFLEGVPLYHEFEVASALAFDLGVYLVVVGGLLTVIAEVGSE